MFEFKNYRAIALDTETTGLSYPRDSMFGFSLAAPDGTACYHDIRYEPEKLGDLIYELSAFKGDLIFHNAPFDVKFLSKDGVDINLSQIYDTVVLACLLNEHEFSYSLDALATKYLGDTKHNDIYADLAAVFGGRATRGVQMKNLYKAEPSLVEPYAKQDALLTMRLWESQMRQVEKQGIQKIVEFERRTTPSIINTSMRGIKVDINRAEQAVMGLTKEINIQQAELNAMVGDDINVNSPKQIRAVFEPKQDEHGNWVANNGVYVPSTDSGSPSLDAEALRSMEHDRRAQLILEIRSTIKTRDTFLRGHVLGHSYDGRVYPTINQAKGEDGGTGTGRLSYTEPALQQIPSRNKRVASIVKPIFLPEEDEMWMSLDMNSFEVRVFAHLVNNPQVVKAYTDNELLDLHQYVSELTGLPRSATYSGQANAKQLNLSMIFNSGNGAIAAKMGMPWEWASFNDKANKLITYKKAGTEAMAVIEEYHRKLPGVRELATKAKSIAEQFGFVETHNGRRLRFPRKFKTYKASGLVIQATAADINKQMWQIAAEVEQGTFLLNVHDSYEFSVPRGTDANAMKDELQRKIRSAVPWFRVPLIIDLNGTGPNYFEVSK